MLAIFRVPVSKVYTASRIFTGESWLNDHAVIVDDNIIREVIPASSLQGSAVAKSYPDHIIAPAFIDLQIYGSAGKLLGAYPAADTLHKLNEYCRSGGTACFLPTIATNTKQVFFQCIDALKEYRDQGGSGIPGLHLEGPWINPLKRGAHIESLIHSPSLEEARELLEYGKGCIQMITLAPEICSSEIIDLILSYDIIISAGHSNANYAEAMNSFDSGITAVTHLFNAMSPLHHREPGLAGAAMDHPAVMASIIPDGYHVDHAAIRIAKKLMKERLFVITDAVTETSQGQYRHKQAGDKYEAEGILSGSTLTMLKGVKNLVDQAGIEADEALRMSSLYPAKVIRCDHRLGKIEKGYEARLVVLDKTFETAAVLG